MSPRVAGVGRPRPAPAREPVPLVAVGDPYPGGMGQAGIDAALRVLVVVNSYPSVAAPSGATYVTNRLRALRGRGDVEMVAVAGDLVANSDSFTTCSGRKVALNIWVREGDQDRTHHAMQALKAERRFQWVAAIRQS